jgi:hypothetical protein
LHCRFLVLLAGGDQLEVKKKVLVAFSAVGGIDGAGGGGVDRWSLQVDGGSDGCRPAVAVAAGLHHRGRCGVACGLRQWQPWMDLTGDKI